jgi:hypothetical protein
MPPTRAPERELVELVRPVEPASVASALTSWNWLGTLTGQQPFMSTALGDLFLYGPGGVWFLDTLQGSHCLEWPTPADLHQFLSSWEGREVMLLSDLVDDAQSAGLAPTAEQVLSFKVPPFAGGSLRAANLEVKALTSTLTQLGDTHRARHHD